MTNVITAEFGKKKPTTIVVKPNVYLNYKDLNLEVDPELELQLDEILAEYAEKFKHRTECLVEEPVLHDTYPNNIPNFPGLKYIKQLTNVIPMGGVKI